MLLPEPTAEPEATTTPAAGSIEQEQDAGADERIAARLSNIFANVPSLAQVTVSVSDGVVTLAGLAPDEAAVDRAAAIAVGVEGVVTVENDIERDLSVDFEEGLGGFGERLSNFTQMLPLIAVALLVALLIIGFGYLLSSLTGIWRRLAPNSFLTELIRSAIRFVFVILGVVAALDMVGAGTLMGAVLGGAGVIGIALGFAMRDTVENYVASLMLSLRQPFRANDWVVIDQHEGRVIRLTSRATILMTLDGNHLRIPNSAVFKAVILNYTRNPERRFDFDLGIDADDDPTAARHLGVEVLKGLDFVLATPEPQARVEAVGDSNIVLRFLGWIDQRETDWYKARSQAIPAVKEALEGAGFAIPEPIYRLRVDPRSAPIATSGPALAASEAPARHAPAAATEEETDVKPADEIARMVEEERADREAGEKDLLDQSRPVE
ncbi:mechanosensitive ion channel family protein [Aurantiacibacter sp. MUD11]|uniref:mechanosensitive ion channel family protein n=1 Tax=Aurantiacibacter sp. MUD11 TaxID=3003265 RepID=UPI0022AAD2B3|nr:mechanosensitive ion channel family protein [Aurantiacibacter sp. MUD11]WAT17359.1 mechanosensitive ion channel family protein [Aurantiacibacter sp. MUD11]